MTPYSAKDFGINLLKAINFAVIKIRSSLIAEESTYL